MLQDQRRDRGLILSHKLAPDVVDIKKKDYFTLTFVPFQLITR